MRFCLVSTQHQWGGGEALLASMGRQWLRAGHSLSCVVRRGSEIERQAVACGITILHATQDRGTNLSDWRAIRRVLRNWSPDAIVLNDSHAVPLVGSAALFCRRPRPLRLAYKHTVFRLHSGLKYRLLSDKLVCVSQAALQVALEGGVLQRHAEMIYGGCQPLHADPTARDKVRAELELAPEQRLLVCVGNLLECKGHRELVQAMASLSARRGDLVAVIAGEGEQRPDLEALIAAHGLSRQVRLLGYRHDVQNLLDAADLVVHPSHSEGLSLVLIQAQMLGKPIVATAVGGTREVLAADSPECTSWLALPGDAQSLANCISQALAVSASANSEFREQLLATSARTHRQFSVATTARKWIELVARLQAA